MKRQWRHCYSSRTWTSSGGSPIKPVRISEDGGGGGKGEKREKKGGGEQRLSGLAVPGRLLYPGGITSSKEGKNHEKRKGTKQSRGVGVGRGQSLTKIYGKGGGGELGGVK